MEPKIGILGCNGRMGKETINALVNQSMGIFAGGYDILPNEQESTMVSFDTIEELIKHSDVIIDFSKPISVMSFLQANKKGVPIVVCSTGFTDTQEEELVKYSEKFPILRSYNASLGVNMVVELVKKAASTLSAENYDIEIVETHHKNKIDCPSGTAVGLGAVAAKARGHSLKGNGIYSRQGIVGERPMGKIGFSSIRGGGVFGEHSIKFIANDEMIEIKHTAFNRAIFASGAINAAKWLAGKPKKLYSMQDVLNDTK